MSLASIILFGIAAFFLSGLAVCVGCMRWVRWQRLEEPGRYPSISLLKPMAGLDDELRQNLESHLALDYPGEWEMLLGVRSEQDAAWPVAREFAEAHPERVRLVLQEGEPGYNPKVNQLITLTRAAKHEVIVLTDSNIRVPRTFLREMAAVLARPGVGLAASLIAGIGERRLGAALDNLMLASYAMPLQTFGTVVLGLNDVTGKSMGMRRADLESLGGWSGVKDMLAEDQQIGRAFKRAGLRVGYCPTPIQNVQIAQSLSGFWNRQLRWLMIHYRTELPMALLEPLLLSAVVGLAGALLSPTSPLAWALYGAVLALDMVVTQLGALVLRGQGFRLRHLLLVPVRELLFLAAWARVATLDQVTWRGNTLHVLKGTRLASPEAWQRMKKMQRLGR